MSRRDPQRGAALIVTLILVTALIAGGALAMYLELADTRSTQYVNQSRAAMFCAEAGLAGGRSYVITNTGSWPAMLDSDASNDPVGYPITGDLDGDGNSDWSVTIKDNDDEFPTNNTTQDSDGIVYMVSTCTEYPDTPRTVMQLVSLSAGGYNYRNQSGQGAGNSNNAN